MKVFYCDCCGQMVFFENSQCVRCGHPLGYLPDLAVMSSLEPAADAQWRSLASAAGGRLYKMCQNYSQVQVCNWMVPAENAEPFCQACRLNRTIPDLSQPGSLDCWQCLEIAKRRLIYSLLVLGLPLFSKQEDPEHGLAFDFLADKSGDFAESAQVMTSHIHGVITINIAEVDDAVREKRRLHLNERYRTVLGHFRHEIGHYYWQRLIRDSDWLAPFRQLFGDERESYDRALQLYYRQGPPVQWAQCFISAYASAHPWEDWAETWAHYLHITDTLETAEAFGLVVEGPPLPAKQYLTPAQMNSFESLIAHWLPLTFALNSLNRSMGLKDLYPFVLSQPVIEKLGFVHQVIKGAQG
jgi:hypothetical protein